MDNQNYIEARKAQIKLEYLDEGHSYTKNDHDEDLKIILFLLERAKEYVANNEDTLFVFKKSKAIPIKDEEQTIQKLFNICYEMIPDIEERLSYWNEQVKDYQNKILAMEQEKFDDAGNFFGF